MYALIRRKPFDMKSRSNCMMRYGVRTSPIVFSPVRWIFAVLLLWARSSRGSGPRNSKTIAVGGADVILSDLMYTISNIIHKLHVVMTLPT